MDDSQQLYEKDSITRIVELLEATFNDEYTYFEATPATPPAADEYPLMIVQKMSGTAVVGPTSTDEVTEEITITVALDKADDVGSANERTTTLRHLQNVIEGQDPATGYYKTDTVLHVLRTYLTANQWFINSNVTISYNQTPRGDQTTLAIANVKCATWRRVIVPGRN
jgi:hypothetical protein